MKLVLIAIITSFLFASSIFSQPTGHENSYTRIDILFSYNNDTLKFVETPIGIECINYTNFKIFSYKTLDTKIDKNVSTDMSVVNGKYMRTMFLSFDTTKKIGLRIKIKNNKTKMIIDFNVSHLSPNEYMPWKIKMTIPFKEGKYKVTNPLDPIIMKVEDEY